MRKAVIGAALAATILTSPAFARDGSTYAGIEGGAIFANGLDVDYDADGDDVIDDNEVSLIDLDTDTGLDIDAVLGHDFGSFRLEAEAAWKRMNVSNITSSAGIDVNPVTAGVQTTNTLDGNLTVKSLMANALFDVNDTFYAGGGVGYGWVDLDGTAGTATTPFIDDSDGGFAWQLIAGLRFPVSSSVDLGLKYRYFNIEGLNMFSPANDLIETGLNSHSVLASLLFNFGAAPPPPPPPPPAPAPLPQTPPPPPPPQTRTCPDGTVVGISQACPLPPPPPVSRTGERG